MHDRLLSMIAAIAIGPPCMQPSYSYITAYYISADDTTKLIAHM